MARPRKPSLTLAPWTRSGYMRVIVRYLENHSIDPLSVVGEEGLRIAEAADPYRKVDLQTVLQAFEKLVAVTDKPDIGLELGMTEPLEDWGPFIFLFLNAPTVREGLMDFCRYGAVLQSQATFELREEGERLSIAYSSNHPELSGWAMDNEITMTLVMDIVDSLVGERITPRAICFEHEPLCALKRYRHWLQITPDFSMPRNELIYATTILEQPLTQANPELYKVMQRHMRDLAEAEIQEDQLSHLALNNINRGLTQGTATLEHVAAELALEPRTLQRRLREEGTSFQALVDEVRLTRARYYLEKTRLTITDIALELGYAEASAFVRAFKRMAAVTPNQYRMESRG